MCKVFAVEANRQMLVDSFLLYEESPSALFINKYDFCNIDQGYMIRDGLIDCLKSFFSLLFPIGSQWPF